MSNQRPRRRGRWAGLAVAAASLAMLAAGCGGSSDEGSTGAAGASSSRPFEGKTIVVNTAGGSLGEYLTEYVFDPFEEQTGAKVETVEGLSQDILAKIRASKGNPPVDVAMLSNSAMAQGAAQGLWEQLDEQRVPALKTLDPKYRFQDDQYAATFNGPVVLVYNKDKVKTPPTSWNDLWDPQHKGHVIIPDFNGCCGVLLLLQTAAMNGGGIDDVDPGFRKLSELSPNLLTLFTSNSQAQTLFTSGQAAIGAWSIDRAVDQVQKGAPIGFVFPKEGAPMVLNSMGVVKGTKEEDLAMAFTDFALKAVGKPEFFTKLASLPGRDDVTVPADFQQFYPTPEDLKKSMIVDWAKAAPQMDEWTQRWQREVAHR